jgi:hypothetical protein
MSKAMNNNATNTGETMNYDKPTAAIEEAMAETKGDEMKKHTNNEIATSWILWQQYVDTDANMTEAEFDALTIGEREAIIVECFGA